MSRTLGRVATAAVGAVAAAATLAGCHFARPAAGSTTNSTPRPVASTSTSPVANASTSPVANASSPPAPTAATRLADAPALVVQCAVQSAGLRPTGQDWFQGGRVVINQTDAVDFDTWWQAHFTPGPYSQTFVIDGHRTHYLAFGATWVRKNGRWVPTHTARNDPQAQQTSLYAWSLWTAAHDKLPPAVCGTTTSARQLQAQVFGTSQADPWSS